MRIAASAFALLLAGAALPSYAQADGCAPSSTGDDSPVFIQRVTDSCPASVFIAAEDVVQYIGDNGPLSSDTYVLAASMTRDDGAVELLTLIKPWSLANYALALAVTRVAIDRGLDDGHTWHWTQPPAETP